MGGGEHSEPSQLSGSTGLGNRNDGFGAMPPCSSSVTRSASIASGSFGSSASSGTTGSPLITLTRYKRLTLSPAWQGSSDATSGSNETKKIESSNVCESDSIFSPAGRVNFQPR